MAGTSALLLAAGLGTRLRGLLGIEKVVSRVGGSRLICYPLWALSAANVDEIVIATRRELAGLLAHAVAECRAPVEARIVESHRWWRGSAWTMLDGLEYVETSVVIVSVSDHIYEPLVVEKLLNQECSKAMCVAADARPTIADVSEATKLLVEGGDVKAVGKDLRSFTHIDVGVHLVHERGIQGPCPPETSSLNDLKSCYAALGELGAVDVTGSSWIDVDRPEDVRRAEVEAASLIRKLRTLWG